ncbi:hypothetical protein L596_003416 [Steinernema carpocapsae]|uniref:Uncharacterized protein n=1 Tax=Steinernema carpocapsae TaxID=34508 RepID=A0A4U8UU29_STECR|nr:hypothetical protein L596_003416 [Steinernema carpocapsae]
MCEDDDLLVATHTFERSTQERRFMSFPKVTQCNPHRPNSLINPQSLRIRGSHVMTNENKYVREALGHDSWTSKRTHELSVTQCSQVKSDVAELAAQTVHVSFEAHYAEGVPVDKYGEIGGWPLGGGRLCSSLSNRLRD